MGLEEYLESNYAVKEAKPKRRRRSSVAAGLGDAVCEKPGAQNVVLVQETAKGQQEPQVEPQEEPQGESVGLPPHLAVSSAWKPIGEVTARAQVPSANQAGAKNAPAELPAEPSELAKITTDRSESTAAAAETATEPSKIPRGPKRNLERAKQETQGGTPNSKDSYKGVTGERPAKRQRGTASETSAVYRDRLGRIVRDKPVSRDSLRKQQARDRNHRIALLNRDEHTERLRELEKAGASSAQVTSGPSSEDPLLAFDAAAQSEHRAAQRRAFVSLCGRKVFKHPQLYPANRFGIAPGALWDGVDRGNGYEQRWLDAQVAQAHAKSKTDAVYND